MFQYHQISNSLDFHKLEDKDSKLLYAVLNINNMIPVPDQCIVQLKYNKVQEFRKFSNEKQKTDYIYLLKKEKDLIDMDPDIIQRKALKLYEMCLRIPDSSLTKRYCKFNLLEQKSKQYKK